MNVRLQPILEAAIDENGYAAIVDCLETIAHQRVAHQRASLSRKRCQEIKDVLQTAGDRIATIETR